MWVIYIALGLAIGWCLIFGAMWLGDYLGRIDI